MPFSIVKEEGRQVLKLEGSVTIRHAQDLACKLLENLEDGLPLRVETRGLEDIDTCIFQLLCSLRQTVPALTFDEPAEMFLLAADRCGLRRNLINTPERL